MLPRLLWFLPNDNNVTTIANISYELWIITKYSFRKYSLIYACIQNTSCITSSRHQCAFSTVLPWLSGLVLTSFLKNLNEKPKNWIPLFKPRQLSKKQIRMHQNLKQDLHNYLGDTILLLNAYWKQCRFMWQLKLQNMYCSYNAYVV